jgi:HTH-type transcriptional regulator/antitoxin HigA
MTEKRIYSDLPIPPGEYLAEVLNIAGMSQIDLAKRMGRPPQAINEIINGEKAVTPETALQLERTLGVPAYLWTRLEEDYRFIKAKKAEEKTIENEFQYLEEAPYPDLARKGYVKKNCDKPNQVRELQRFYGVASLPNINRVKAYAAAYRCSTVHQASPYALAAWLRCAEIEAGKITTPPFTKSKLKASFDKIRHLTLAPFPDSIGKLREILGDCGVALVLMPHLAKTIAHGAALWPDPEHPVLVLSIRGSWADIFWLGMFHEIGHILLHGRKVFIDAGEINSDSNEEEIQADRFAAGILIPEERYKEFRQTALFDENSIMDFAKNIDIHPGIVVGRLQHDGRLPPKTPFNKFRARLVGKRAI